MQETEISKKLRKAARKLEIQSNKLRKKAEELEKEKRKVPTKKELDSLTKKIRGFPKNNSIHILNKKLMLNMLVNINCSVQYSNVDIVDIEFIPLKFTKREKNICEFINTYLPKGKENYGIEILEMIHNSMEFKNLRKDITLINEKLTEIYVESCESLYFDFYHKKFVLKELVVQKV